MSDAGRKNFSDKVKETFTPESQKSNMDKLSEGATDKMDQAGSHLQPEEEKGMFQKISDTITGHHNRK